MLFINRSAARWASLFFVILLAQAGSSKAAIKPEEQEGNHPVMQQDELEQYYHLFVDTFYLAPTSLQTQTIGAALSIWCVLHNPPQPPGEAALANLAQATRQHYDLIRQQYPVLKVRWGTEGLAFAGPRPILEATRRLPRLVIVELTNDTPTKLNARTAVEGDITAGQEPALVPPGAMRPLTAIVSVSEAGQQSVKLSIVSGKDAAGAPSLEIPLKLGEPALLRGTTLNGETGKPSPARVYAEGSDGIFRRANEYAGDKTLSEKPLLFCPASMQVPFFYCDGQFEVLLPPGRTRLTLERGFEHPLVTKELELKAGQTAQVTLASSRFLDMKQLGWISGDTAFHGVKSCWDENEGIGVVAMIQRAEDLRVLNNLIFKQWRAAPQGEFIKPDAYPVGPVPGFCGGDYHIQIGEEFRNDRQYGHINLLNIKNLIQPISTGPGCGDEQADDYPTNKTAIEQAHAQGGICVFTHGLGPMGSGALPADMALGLTDVLEQLSPDDYYKFLNCGFRVGLSNGSDHPSRLAGCARVYVKSGPELSYPQWIDGLRRGKTFTTSGPLLFLTVNGVDVGGVIKARPGTPLHVVAQVQSRYPVGNIQLVCNGQVVQGRHTTDCKAEIEWTIKAEDSLWIVARCGQGEVYDALAGPHIAHTSAIYVEVDGRGIFRKTDAEFLISLLKTGRDRLKCTGRFANAQQLQEALDYYDQGIRVYRELIEKYAKIQ